MQNALFSPPDSYEKITYSELCRRRETDHRLPCPWHYHTFQAPSPEPLEETDPAGLVLFHDLNSTKNFTISVIIYRYCHKNSHIFKLSAPIAAQIDPIHIDIRILPTLQRTVALILDMAVRFFVQLTDGGWKTLWPYNVSVMSSTRQTDTLTRYNVSLFSIFNLRNLFYRIIRQKS